MDKLKILVCAHKQDHAYCDSVYTPIQVGSALAGFDLGFLRDDSGENISNKNPYYCELTAQYWAWKNLDCEYLGLAHYRRYFSKRYTNENIDESLRKHDVILARPIHLRNALINKAIYALTYEDVYLFIRIITDIFPEYRGAALRYMVYDNKDIAYNMFVCRKTLFDEFAEWQFEILSACEKKIQISPYSRMKRVFGYLGEYLLPIFFKHNKKRILFDDVVPLMDSREVICKQSISRRIKSDIISHLYSNGRNDMLRVPDPIYLGLKNDGLWGWGKDI
jgi:hypothetical protein